MRSPAAERVPLVLLAAAAAFLAIAALYQVQFYLCIPADLVSFAESPYVSDIIKLRLGVPIYTPIPDNNAYPYTPLSQILTYGIGAALGHGTDIPFLRTVQFGYVLLASLVAGLACRHLAFLALPEERRESGGLWFAAGTLLIFLVALDPQFNLYVHTLHNDGLALLISMTGAWLALRHARGPRAWHLVAMALLPAVGFLVKQNQLMWAGLFTVYLWIEGSTPKRRVILFAAGAGVAAAAVMGGAVLLWGQNFVYWIFGALGDKKVSLGRSLLHLQWAGAYAAMGLLALWRFVLPGRSRQVTALWAMWAFCFAITTYTSGLGFSANHMGPAVVLAASWFLVFMRDIWPRALEPGLRGMLPPLTAAALVLCVWAGIGVVRPPKSAVPRDLARYVTAIEREFDGMDTTVVLLDNGSWLYLRRGVLMKDRSMPVSLHVGSNQRVINRAALAETIGRIGERRYQRILAHALDTERSPYDFQNRGSGVKAAILENYRIVRRIPEVAGIEDWWPKNLLSEVVVLEPRADSTPRR